MALLLAEILYLRNYFHSVDKAISSELDSATVAYEEFLTPTLGRLLDSRSPFQALLEYPLKQLNQDLAECGSGNKLLVEFETHEHAKGFSGSVSHADLGIILRQESPLTGEFIEKAILVESKRLYPVKDKYSLRSRYTGFDLQQFNSLSAIAKTYDQSGVYYFLYNPSLTAFDDTSAKVIRALENSICENSMEIRGLTNRFFGREEYYMIGARGGMTTLRLGPLTSPPDPNQIKEALKQMTSRRPGLKVISLQSLDSIVRSKPRLASSFSLGNCYQYLQNFAWHRDDDVAVPFISFGTFMVDYFLSCYRGSTNPNLISIAAGKPVTRPDSPTETQGGSNVLARHTLTITLESTLPEIQGFTAHQ
jgi:hypothetical protein